MKLILQCDETWSLVGKKRCKRWPPEVAGDGRPDAADRGDARGQPWRGGSHLRGRALWANPPAAYRERAEVYTDFWEAYTSVVPGERHHRAEGGVGKGEAGTQRIERFNCTLRQRCSGLVRKVLSFSKKLENPIGAIGNDIHDYNATLPA